MNGRGLVEVSALILATLATAGVFMYSRGVQGTAEPMVAVVVSNADIPARTDLNELIKDEQFKIIYVPESVVLDGAVTSVHQLRSRHNSVKILAGELILVARTSGLSTRWLGFGSSARRSPRNVPSSEAGADRCRHAESRTLGDIPPPPG